MKNWIKKNDVLAKVFALLIAVMLWLYVANLVDTNIDVPVRNLAPVFQGSEDLLNTYNLAITDQADIAVDVVVSGARQDLIGLDKDDVQVIVDISNLKEPGVYHLPYSINLSMDSAKVVRKTPGEVTVKLDRVTTATVPVRVALVGEVEKGFMTDEIVTNPSSLTLTGMTDVISKISYAQVKISKQSINASIDESVAYVFYDAEDNIVESKNVRVDYNMIRVTVPVLKLIEFPLAIDFVEGGGATLKHVNYELKPDKIQVAVDSAHANDKQPIKIGVVDLAKLSDSSSIPFQITLPEGYKNVSGETSVTATVELSGLSKKRMTIGAIEIINIPSGYRIEPITNALEVTLRGEENVLNAVGVENVRAVVDLSATVLTPGQHTMPAKIVVDGTSGVGSVGEYKVVVRVSK